MAFRDLVTGAAGCGDAASSSNPIAKLANSLLGTFQKDQEYRERPSVPTQQEVGAASEQEHYGTALSLPGSESFVSQPQFQNDHRSEFGRHYDVEDMVSQFQRIDWATEGLGPGPGPPPSQQQLQQHPALVGYLRNFFDSSRAQVPFRSDGLPDIDLSAFDKQRIRDRSSIIARHFVSDKGDEFMDAQVSTLLLSLNIEDGVTGRAAFAPRFSEMEAYWNASQPWKPVGQVDQWAQEFSQEHPAPNGWVQEFRDHHQADWAAQFAQERARARPSMSELEGLDKSRSIVETLSGSQDPKFQNSKFLHFVSKMSRGELIIEDNQVKENTAASWANEYSTQTQPDKWAAEFTAGEHARRSWADEFTEDSRRRADAWIQEYTATAPQSWVDEFHQENNWQDSYEKFLEEELSNAPQSASSFPYTFADENPYVGHANPLKEGQELFRRGLLSEAVLALEAEVLKNPGNAEGWRLLGVTHAENDDDRQAIASMVRARDADPTNLEVLLALGVSHTNELQQGEALRYLRGWLQHHPVYGKLVSNAGNIDQLSHFQVASLYHEAAAMAPEDGDVHTVLGVLYNLSKEYDKAIQAFETALKLKPRDYSLWNKLGATQANSTRSADAIHAYQQALNLKPNYVRAWSNMGIGYANQSRYAESIPYYVRALAMNPKAENAWQYLRISLSAGRPDLLDACERHDLDALQAQFPM